MNDGEPPVQEFTHQWIKPTGAIAVPTNMPCTGDAKPLGATVGRMRTSPMVRMTLRTKALTTRNRPVRPCPGHSAGNRRPRADPAARPRPTRGCRRRPPVHVAAASARVQPDPPTLLHFPGLTRNYRQRADSAIGRADPTAACADPAIPTRI